MFVTEIGPFRFAEADVKKMALRWHCFLTLLIILLG